MLHGVFKKRYAKRYLSETVHGSCGCNRGTCNESVHDVSQEMNDDTQ